MEMDRAEVERFFEGARFRSDLYARFKHKTDRYLASEFNVFDYLRKDENALSRIIADLLTPDGTHGQGALFITEFVRELDRALDRAGCMRLSQRIPSLFNDVEHMAVKCEARTSYIANYDRRLDIRLDCGEFKIGIENKPSAADQHEQLSDYAEDLRRSTSDRFLLVYLSGSGGSPAAESLPESLKNQLKAQGAYVEINYSMHMRNWLQSCYRNCEAEKLRWFLRDFITHVEREFGRGSGPD